MVIETTDESVMKHLRNNISIHRTTAAAAVMLSLILIRGTSADDAIFFNVDVAPVQPAAAAPAPAAVDVAAPVAKEAKPAVKAEKKPAAARPARTARTIFLPLMNPNPLAFSMTWLPISNKALLQARALANRKKLQAARIVAAPRPQLNAAAQNALQLQMRKFFEPMLKAELSFASRATDLNPAERKKLTADGKEWFEVFLVDFMKKQDPNQQQMMLQGVQGVWFGNQQQRPENPRDAIKAGIAKLVKEKLSKEKAAAYDAESKSRAEFARQVSVENLVERIDQKVKLSPDQWKKISKSVAEHWDNNRDPQLEAFALNPSMWPGAPDQWVLPELSTAQQAVLKRVNTMSGQMFFAGGIFGQMFGGDGGAVIDDVDLEAVKPAAAADNAKAEAE